MQPPLVSIVMPTLNQGGFIEQAIRSVLDQDYPEVELVVADGGSTDATLGVLESALARYGPRLRWVSERDGGPANAVNKALKLAGGSILGWLNSDDLFAEGAIGRAVACFGRHPGLLMIYGEAEHIDVAGRSLGRYPTLPMPAPIEAFHSGCFICQPSVFMSREFLDVVGWLDENLKTAFDFDLWLRCFKSHADRIGFIPEVQAFSRLHEGAITLTQRRQVALEGLTLLARHVGRPQAHWFWTYLDELCDRYPAGAKTADLASEVTGFLEQTSSLFARATRDEIRERLFGDARLRLSIPGAFANAHPDGWAGPSLAVKMRRPRPGAILHLACDNPSGSSLSIRVRMSWQAAEEARSIPPGPFDLRFDVPARDAGEWDVAVIETENALVPRQVAAGTESRLLAFKVESIRWLQH